MAQVTSPQGLESIKQHEGMKFKAYQDPVGIWTIGFGHTGNVKPGDKITPEQAHELLVKDVATAERCVRQNVTVSLTQGQFDALVSFTFNLGCGRLRTSTMLRLLNEGDYEGAAEQLPRWNKAGGKVWPGLVRRREDERQMFLQVEVASEQAS